jgi:hypothetical protein
VCRNWSALPDRGLHVEVTVVDCAVASPTNEAKKTVARTRVPRGDMVASDEEEVTRCRHGKEDVVRRAVGRYCNMKVEKIEV